MVARGPIFFFFFNDTATTEIYTLSLHDALPISRALTAMEAGVGFGFLAIVIGYLPVIYQSFSRREVNISLLRSEEHTSELQSQSNLVCRLLLEKKKKNELLLLIHLIIQTQ